WRNTPAAPLRRHAPCLTPALAPSNYRTNAHLEDLGYLPPRRSAFNCFNRTLTQVRGIRPRHRFSSPGESISPRFAQATAVGNPSDSMPTGNALESVSVRSDPASPRAFQLALGDARVRIAPALESPEIGHPPRGFSSTRLSCVCNRNH